jgi:hypothetical protein
MGGVHRKGDGVGFMGLSYRRTLFSMGDGTARGDSELSCCNKPTKRSGFHGSMRCWSLFILNILLYTIGEQLNPPSFLELNHEVLRM